MNREDNILILEQKELLDIFKARCFNLEREINVKDSHIRVLENQICSLRKEIRDLELEAMNETNQS